MISCKVLVKNHNEPNESVNYNVFNNNNNNDKNTTTSTITTTTDNDDNN